MIRNLIIIFSALIWLPPLVIVPIIGYKDGTSRDVEIEVLAEPFEESPVLVYKWSGDVFRSCPVDIRRQIVDSIGVVTTLNTRTLGALDPDRLGPATLELHVEVPRLIAEGPATYHAVEYPKCSWMQRVWPVAVEYPVVNFTVTR